MPIFFVAKAASATTDLDAYFFVRVASLMVQYGRSQSPITSVEAAGASIVCRDANNRLVVPLWADYMEWTPRLDGATTTLLERARAEGRVGATIFATGQWSPAASTAMSQHGIPTPHASSDLPGTNAVPASSPQVGADGL